MTADARIERVITGVIAQAVRDARATRVTIVGESADAALLRVWCARALGAAAVGNDGLLLHPANKTALLLGDAPAADMLPFGDLYYTQVVGLAGSATTTAALETIAAACGGFAALDRALQQFFDERIAWERATAHVSPDVRDQLRAALEAARFRRARLALVPKLGARTLGIDLYA